MKFNVQCCPGNIKNTIKQKISLSCNKKNLLPLFIIYLPLSPLCRVQASGRSRTFMCASLTP